MATKSIKFDLQINGKRISTFEELQDNFNAELLPIFQSGRLHKWFMSRGMTEQADEVKAIDTNGGELEQLTSICKVLELEVDEEALGFILEDFKKAAQQAATTSKVEKPEIGGDGDENQDSETTGTGVDWSGQDMSGKSFVGEDFRNGKFVGTNFSKCDLSNADFSGADLSNAKFFDTDLSGTKFEKSKLIKSSFSCITRGLACFNNADLTNSKIDNSYFNGAKFNKAIISNSEMNRVVINNCEFKDAIISRSVLSHVYYWNADFQGCDFSFTKFSAQGGDCFLKVTQLMEDTDENVTVIDSALLLGIFGKIEMDITVDQDSKHQANFTKAKLTGIEGLDKSLIDLVTKNFLNQKKNDGSRSKPKVGACWPFPS